MKFNLPIPGYDWFTLSISLANWPLRKGLKRLIPRVVHATPPGPEGWPNSDMYVLRWMWLRVDWGVL